MYEIRFDDFIFPLAVSKINISGRGENENFYLLSGQEVNLPGVNHGTEISLEVLLPQEKYPFAIYGKEGFQNAFYYIKKIEKIYRDGKDVFLKIKRQGVNGKSNLTSYRVVIKSYTIIEKSENGTDVVVLLNLREYININVINENNDLVGRIGTVQETDNKPVYNSHTVVKGDTLWSIAQKYFRDGSLYKKLYDYNREVIDKGNYNTGNPLYTIYPNQELYIPPVDKILETQTIISTLPSYNNSSSIGSNLVSMVGNKNPVSEIKISKNSLDIYKGDLYTLSIATLPLNAIDKNITWKSSDIGVVRVSRNGSVTGVKEGTATITALSSNGKTAYCVVEVINKNIPIIPVTGIKLMRGSIDLMLGEEGYVTAVKQPVGATSKLRWRSSDEKIVTVSPNGLAKAIGIGTATVSVFADNCIKECRITVNKINFTLYPLNLKLKSGDNYEIKITPYLTDIIWSSDDDTVADVTCDGFVTGLKTGITKIWASTPDGGSKKSITVEVHYSEIEIEIGDSCFFNNTFSENYIIQTHGENGIIDIINEEGLIIAVRPGMVKIEVVGIGNDCFHHIINVKRQEVIKDYQIRNLSNIYDHDKFFDFNTLKTDDDLIYFLFEHYMDKIYGSIKGSTIGHTGSIWVKLPIPSGNGQDFGFYTWLDIMYGYLRDDGSYDINYWNHELLDIISIMPFIGTVATGVNAALYRYEKKEKESFLYTAFTIISFIADAGALIAVAKLTRSSKLRALKSVDFIDEGQKIKAPIKFVEDASQDIINLTRDFTKVDNPQGVILEIKNINNLTISQIENYLSSIAIRISDLYKSKYLVGTSGAKYNPAKVCVAIDIRTGDVYFGLSGKPKNPTRSIYTNSQLSDKINNAGKIDEDYDFFNCAEFNAVNNALRNGCDPSDLYVYTVSNRKGEYAKPCENCKKVYRGFVNFFKPIED